MNVVTQLIKQLASGYEVNVTSYLAMVYTKQHRISDSDNIHLGTIMI